MDTCDHATAIGGRRSRNHDYHDTIGIAFMNVDAKISKVVLVVVVVFGVGCCNVVVSYQETFATPHRVVDNCSFITTTMNEC